MTPSPLRGSDLAVSGADLGVISGISRLILCPVYREHRVIDPLLVGRVHPDELGRDALVHVGYGGRDALAHVPLRTHDLSEISVTTA